MIIEKFCDEIVFDVFDKLKHENLEMFKIKSYTANLEKCVLYHLAMALPDGFNAVEIGSQYGASSCFLAHAAMKKNGRVHCVDTFMNMGMEEAGEEQKDTLSDFLANTTKYKDWISTLKLKSDEAANYFNEKVDLVFVDGDHTFEGVKTDIKSWLPHYKYGGTVIFHDWGGRCRRLAIRKAVERFIWPIQNGPGHSFMSLYWCQIGEKK